MKTNFNGRKIAIKPAFAERTESKLQKLDKFFEEDACADVTVAPEGDALRVEITVRGNGMVLRAEQTADDAHIAVDGLIDTLLRQIRRNKTKLEKRLRRGAFDEWAPLFEQEEEPQIVRTKTFPVKPMDVHEAILQMNLSGHTFYAFLDAESGKHAVVYRRNNGDYGLLLPDA